VGGAEHYVVEHTFKTLLFSHMVAK